MTKIQTRRGTAAQWSSANPILSAGEQGWDTTNTQIKVGDGVTNWNTLPFFLASDLLLKAPLASPAFTGTPTGITKTHVGLGSVDNTTDVAKPVSTAQQTALNLKAPLASPAFTGTPTGITKTHVGLGSVDNTTDVAKPVSTAQQTALNLKANLASPAFTGTPTGITKTHVGLANVDNTSDVNKPLSTPQTTAVNTKIQEAMEDSQTPPARLGNRLRKLGVIIAPTTSSSYDNLSVESLTTLDDPESGRIAGVYTSYGNITGVERASIVLAYSDDGQHWEKQGVLLAGSGTGGSGDENGCTGPVLVWHNNLYHLFYIGLTATGYEGGTKTLMVATSPSLKTPTWTRLGVIMAPGGTGWRQEQVWHPNIIRHEGLWYCFVNASDIDDKERIGYATATNLTGPWTFDDVNSPLIDLDTGEIIAGDPCVTKVPGGWRMDYFTVPAVGANDWYTTTTDEDFPLGWTPHENTDTQRKTVSPGPAGSFDELYAHKPWIMRHGGSLFHYYTAVMAGNTNRSIALAVDSRDTPVTGGTMQVATPVNVGTFCSVKSNSGDSILILASASAYTYGLTPQARVQARTGDILEIGLAFVSDDKTSDLRVDAVTLNGTTKVNYVSLLGASGHGVTAWGTVGGRYTHQNGVFHYTVQTADVISGTVTLRPVFKADTGTGRNILNDLGDPQVFWVKNLG